ncbi:MAG: hypothetical protein KDD99_00820 [Bacteroidetes bacterium]|nr:hypothetical protein [Bacteroidota bacterium]
MKLLNKISRWFLLPSDRKINKLIKDFAAKTKIIQSDHHGFSITNFDEEGKATILWKDLEDVKIENGRLITIQHRKTKHVLTADDIGWYQLIQQVPPGFKSYDYAYVKNFFLNLTGCKICGLMAVEDKECLACGSAVWNPEMLDSYDSEAEYLKQEQICLFEPIDDEKIDISNRPENGFQSDPTWKPLISREDLEG